MNEIRSSGPKVTIAIPVFNGEAFLDEAIDSVRKQTFADWELILGDNASTDRTSSICRKHAEQDERIRYVRNESNIGAAKNFNSTVGVARGEYFRWLAADSSLHPEYLEECVKRLEADSSVAGVCTGFASIVPNSEEHPLVPGNFSFMENAADERVKALIDRVIGIRGPMTVWALMRLDLLRQTGLIRPFIGADSVFVLEYIFRGKLDFVDRPLSLIRRHSDSYSDMKYENDGVEGRREARWFDPNSSGRFYLPHWRRLWEYLKLVLRSDCSIPTRLRICMHLASLTMRWRKQLVKEVWYAMGLRGPYQTLRKALGKRDLRGSFPSS